MIKNYQIYLINYIIKIKKDYWKANNTHWIYNIYSRQLYNNINSH